MSSPVPAPAVFESWIVLAVIFAGILAVALVAFQAFGIAIPAFVITIGWILVVAFVAIAAIKILFRMF